MQDFRKLKVWELSHELTLIIYKTSQRFPKEEIYGLTSQLKRASSSIAINIAEGCGRGSSVDFGRFLQISMGSASETEYLLILIKELGYFGDDGVYSDLNNRIAEIKKMLSSLIVKIKK